MTSKLENKLITHGLLGLPSVPTEYRLSTIIIIIIKHAINRYHRHLQYSPMLNPNQKSAKSRVAPVNASVLSLKICSSALSTAAVLNKLR